jgi:predicted acetyltransferase
MAELTLRPMTVEDEKVAWQAHEELAADDFMFLLNLEDGESWASYVARLERFRLGIDVPENLVPATFLLAEVDGEVVGRTSIRHRLNDALRAWGGHIGYGVRPAYRRRGYATQILRRSLDVARSVNIPQALVCCDEDNVASAKVIERCGGVLEDVIEPADGHGRMRRYWIELR